MTKHRIALLVLLVAIGFGYFVLIRFQHANAIPPAGTVVSGQSGLVITGGTAVGGVVSNPAQVDGSDVTPTGSGSFIPDDAVDPNATIEDAAACP